MIQVTTSILKATEIAAVTTTTITIIKTAISKI
jgi:hypothetical protein